AVSPRPGRAPGRAAPARRPVGCGSDLLLARVEYPAQQVGQSGRRAGKFGRVQGLELGEGLLEALPLFRCHLHGRHYPSGSLERMMSAAALRLAATKSGAGSADSGSVVTPVMTSIDRHRSPRARAMSVSGRSPTTQIVPAGIRSSTQRRIASLGFPAVSPTTPAAVSTSAAHAPAPGCNAPFSIGNVGSRLVTIRRAPLRAASAARVARS